MKKLFTLLFTFGILTSVFAQYNHDNDMGRSDRNENNTGYQSKSYNGNYYKPAPNQEFYDRDDNRREYSGNDRRYDNAFSMNGRERDFRIQKISREYDFRINSVYANRYLMPREQNWQVQNLQRQKYDEIRNIEICFNDNRNRYNDGHSNRW